MVTKSALSRSIYLMQRRTRCQTWLAWRRRIVNIDRRKKWSLQIRETIAQLHEISVVWGDAKPDNVLIDSKTDDIYIIDFGGGYTDGCGAEATMNTIEGDVQASKKIDNYLQI
ncbi:hypothetical protein F4776DRAFT_125823 [Hypoxylon sp. NC0597]|nr:hypothetical protein F4776DRAFT_125823 [Hypoxylon sp. NC0597]